MKRRKLNLTIQYVLIFGVLLLAANIILSIVLFNQSRSALRGLLDKNMLNITNTAAGLMDGDRLGALTEDDVGGDYFQEVIRTLTVFQERVEIEFIYAVKQAGPEEFVFTVDPDPVDPGQFGEPIVVTPALLRAGEGVATVDALPQADRWGNFYSAYSPVFDSAGAVAGIIGVDFDADWYEQQVQKFTQTVLLISLLTVLVGVAVIALITQRTRKRFLEMDAELAVLSADIDELTEVITSNPGYAKSRTPAEAPAPAAGGFDEIGAISSKIRTMETDLHDYLDYLHAQANTDALTGVGNTSAYTERVELLDREIAAGGAAFAVGIFDVDGLKQVNDQLGHACGDMIIRAAAGVISRVFGKEQLYRIGGDEFLVIRNGPVTESEMEALLRRVQEAAARYTTAEKALDGRLCISGGAAVFRPGEDTRFKDVFPRTDEAMYACKSKHHAARE